jgi:hypothetical protein
VRREIVAVRDQHVTVGGRAAQQPIAVADRSPLRRPPLRGSYRISSTVHANSARWVDVGALGCAALHSSTAHGIASAVSSR